MVDRPKEITQIDVNDNLFSYATQYFMDCFDGIMTTPSWPEPVGSFDKVWFIDRVQNLRIHSLNDFILDIANTKVPVFTITLRDFSFPRWCWISPTNSNFELFQEIFVILLSIVSIGFAIRVLRSIFPLRGHNYPGPLPPRSLLASSVLWPGRLPRNLLIILTCKLV